MYSKGGLSLLWIIIMEFAYCTRGTLPLSAFADSRLNYNPKQNDFSQLHNEFAQLGPVERTYTVSKQRANHFGMTSAVRPWLEWCLRHLSPRRMDSRVFVVASCFKPKIFPSVVLR